ncbi:MAG: DsbA family protein [Alphaproteobacteria bacterium]|nr:DsbA family protein [Alphaproteobacteria bacterium]
MDNFIKKISNILSLAVIFCFTAMFYFNYKGFVYENGKIELSKQTANAADVEYNGIAVVLPSNIVINASQKYAIGTANAPLTMYEYSSLGCPHCADFHLDVVPDLIKEYVNTGLLRIIFVNFPLDKTSMKAAMLSRCMVYENYLPYIDAMFAAQRSWWSDTNEEQLFRHAAEHGLSYDEAQSCVNNDKLAQEIIADRLEAIKRLNVKGTPAFYITGADGNEIIYGAVTYRQMAGYLNSRLQRLGYVQQQ